MNLKNDESLDDLIVGGFKIIQKKEGYRFSIDPILLANFLDIKPEDKIIDFGTGTGVIPFLLAERHKKISVKGIDIQEENIELANRSKRLNGIENVDFEVMDINSISKEYSNTFDMVVSNPPFFKPEEGHLSDNEKIRISRHEVKVDFFSLVKKARAVLKEKGSFNFIHTTRRFTEIMKILNDNKLFPKRIRFIHPYKDSESNLFMIEAVKNRKTATRILKPLIIYEEKGIYSKEVLSYYEK